VALVLAYSALMRWLGNAPREDVERLRHIAAKLQRDFEEHQKTWEAIGLQWRSKVIELEQKCDRVVVDAKNEIAGDLASVQNITSKGWR
jgi:hypothetical protein